VQKLWILPQTQAVRQLYHLLAIVNPVRSRNRARGCTIAHLRVESPAAEAPRRGPVTSPAIESATPGLWLSAAARFYANGRDLKKPYLSPVYGDYEGFPPTILTAGARDLFLSNTIRVHRRLRRAGVIADLNIFEGMSHAQFASGQAPESREVFEEIARFFDSRLGR
jgi:acetyl esterase/lipase